MNDKYINTNADVAGLEELTKFDVFMQNHRYADSFTTGYAYIFVTKPMLFLYPYKPRGNTSSTLEKLAYENMTRDHTFSQFLIEEAMNENDKTLIKQLSYYNNFDTANFLPIFTNRVKSFQTMDVNLVQNENFDTRHGFRMPLPTHKVESIGSSSTSLICSETMNLDFIKMMTLWVNYISNVTDGTFHANPAMIKNNVIDYMSSIYYFLLEPDGTTLKYWAKYTGAWPTSIPQSNLSFSRGDQSTVELDIAFAYSSKEDMNPSILEDFNRVSLNYFETRTDDFNRVSLNYFETRTIDVLEDEYPSVKKSPLLAPESLKANPNFFKETRGPLVYFKSGLLSDSTNSTPMTDKFELSFGENVFESTFIENIVESEYFFDSAKEFFATQLDE